MQKIFPIVEFFTVVSVRIQTWIKRDFFFKLFILREREREPVCMSRGGAEREGERIPRRPCTVNAEPDAGLKPTHHEIMTRAQIKSQMLIQLSNPGARRLSKTSFWGTQLAQSVEHTTLHLRVVSSSPTLGLEITSLKKTHLFIQFHLSYSYNLLVEETRAFVSHRGDFADCMPTENFSSSLLRNLFPPFTGDKREAQRSQMPCPNLCSQESGRFQPPEPGQVGLHLQSALLTT